MKKVDYEHFGRFAFPCNLSARGEDLYFTVKRADFEDNDYKSDLYRVRDGVTEQLTVTGDVNTYWLLHEGIVFPALRRQKDKEEAKAGKPLTVLQLLPYACGEAREFLRLNYHVTGARFLSAEKFFFTASYSHDYMAALNASGGDTEKAIALLKENSDYQVIDELPFWYNGKGYINKTRSRLYLYDKGEVRPITDEYTNASIVGLSADDSRLLYKVTRFINKEETRDSLLMLDTDTLKALDVSMGTKASHYGACFLPDGDLLVVANTQDVSIDDNPKVFRCSFEKRTRTVLYAEGEHNFDNSVGTDIRMGRSLGDVRCVIGNELFFLSTLDDSSHIMALNADTGEIRRITDERGSVNEFVPWKDGFAALAMRRLDGTELYAIGMDSKEVRLTDLQAETREYETSRPIDTFYENEKGTIIHGFVLPPVNREEGKKYPTLLDIHGGPKTVYGNGYYHEMQLWASMGYAVIFCNPTGGDGRGDDFANIRGHFGETDYHDIMGFLDKVIEENDFIDADRLGVLGGSYGGFMTNWIIGHTDRFKAAASQRSIASFASFFGTSDIGPDFTNLQITATPWEDLDVVWRQSPLKYADRIKTPTLFIHSEEDYRCPLSEGMQMFSALKYFGVPTRMCIFKGENHELSRSGKPRHRVRRLKEITEWFDRYLRGEEQ